MLLTFSIAYSKPANAGVIVYVYQSGADVKAELSGSFSSLAGAINIGTVFYPAGIAGGRRLNGGNGITFANSSSGSSSNYYNFALTSGANTGWGLSSTTPVFATSYTASGVGTNGGISFANDPMDDVASSLYFSSAYVNGTPITATNVWANTTMATLGLDATGTYVYTNVGSSETFTVVIGSPPGGGGAAVPEPSSLAVASLLGLIGWRRSRRKQAVSNC